MCIVSNRLCQNPKKVDSWAMKREPGKNDPRLFGSGLTRARHSYYKLMFSGVKKSNDAERYRGFVS